eukprot:gene35512-43783_t
MGRIPDKLEETNERDVSFPDHLHYIQDFREQFKFKNWDANKHKNLKPYLRAMADIRANKKTCLSRLNATHMVAPSLEDTPITALVVTAAEDMRKKAEDHQKKLEEKREADKIREKESTWEHWAGVAKDIQGFTEEELKTLKVFIKMTPDNHSDKLVGKVKYLLTRMYEKSYYLTQVKVADDVIRAQSRLTEKIQDKLDDLEMREYESGFEGQRQKKEKTENVKRARETQKAVNLTQYLTKKELKEYLRMKEEAEHCSEDRDIQKECYMTETLLERYNALMNKTLKRGMESEMSFTQYMKDRALRHKKQADKHKKPLTPKRSTKTGTPGGDDDESSSSSSSSESKESKKSTATPANKRKEESESEESGSESDITSDSESQDENQTSDTDVEVDF